ncbi:MAG: alpha/beta hydrolase [Dechloromonas sp.]|nr:alpha/beta hydrolase [Dechloromonas sp.]
MAATTPTTSKQAQDLVIPGPTGPLALRLYRPGKATAALPVVLYFHGGGFVGGSLDDADQPASFIAEHSPALVLAVGYALAPARPFPAAPEDAHAAALWAAEHAAELGGDPSRLAVAGDDAGGNLAAALTLIARDRNGPAIAAQVLVGPMLDPSMTRLGDGARLNSDLSAATCAACYRQYLPQPRQRLHPYASPLASVRQAGLPPALIVTAECDVLHNEAEKYAAALIAAGVPTQVVRFAGINHAALTGHRPVLDEIAHFLNRRLRPADVASQYQ